jgi:glycosyltransferase involved in cell wall biosynthesis
VLVVGEGPERAHFTARLPNDAVFTGYLHGEGLARAYASADIFLNPSVTETFGIVTLESMASGLPGVCADATGSQSLVEEGVSGHLVDPRDVDGYVAAVEGLVLDGARRARMGEAAHRLSLRYTWDAVMAEIVSYYREAVKAGPT